MSKCKSFISPITRENNPRNKINKKNLGKIARSKSRVWFWFKYLNTLGAITDVCNKMMPHIMPEMIDSRLFAMSQINHKSR